MMMIRSVLKPLTAQRAGYMLMGLCGGNGVVLPTNPARCEGLPKDSDGNIEWSKIPSSITEQGFWDDVAKSAGETVSGCRSLLLSSLWSLTVANIGRSKGQ